MGRGPNKWQLWGMGWGTEELATVQVIQVCILSRKATVQVIQVCILSRKAAYITLYYCCLCFVFSKALAGCRNNVRNESASVFGCMHISKCTHWLKARCRVTLIYLARIRHPNRAPLRARFFCIQISFLNLNNTAKRTWCLARHRGDLGDACVCVVG